MSKWGKLQFHHHDSGARGFRYSVAVDMPPSHDFLRSVLQMFNGITPDPINLKVGIAIVNPKDSFDRKVGREVTAARLEELPFHLVSLRFIRSGKAEIVFHTEKGMCVQVHILTDRECTPHLIEVWGTRGHRE